MPPLTPVQHGFNAALILGEAFLNSLPIFAYLMGYVGLWSSLYGIWAQLHYLRTGRFLYPVSYFAFLLCARVAHGWCILGSSNSGSPGSAGQAVHH